MAVTLEDNTEKIYIENVNACSKAIVEIATEIVAEAKSVSPVRTGNLRSSVNFTVDPKAPRALVGATADYAPFVEAKTPFLRPSVNTITKQKGENTLVRNLRILT